MRANEIIKKSWILMMALFFGGPSAIYAQKTFVDTLRNAFDGKSKLLLQEKVYVQTDKSLYVTGETIWFKLYVVDASFHELMDASKVAYVEILSADQKAIQQLKVELHQGIGDGFFEIPGSIVSGNYHLRAYTSWMKNFSAEFYFEKNISIVNPNRNSGKLSSASLLPTIQFFPEGGNLVAGLESKIGFAAKDLRGKGISVRGSIIDQSNDTVVRFYSLKFGLGNFTLTPAPGNIYKAICYWPDGSISIQELPKAFDKGYVMRMEELGDELVFRISKRGLPSDKQVYLLVQCRQQLKQASIKRLNEESTGFSIDKTDLPEGISQITLFDERRQPVCERLYFKRPKDTLHFEIQTNKQQYHTREKINVSFTSKNQNGITVASNTGVSVFLLDSLQLNDAAGISTYFYLTSELRGNIDSATYYLSANDARVNEACDNLVLTHGWRRFKWNELLADHQPVFEFLPEVGGHLVNARLNSRNAGASPKGITTFMSIPGDKFSFVSSVSGEAGQVRFEANRFYGAGELVLQTNYEKDSNFRIDLISPFSEKYSTKTIPPLQVQKTRESQLTNLSTASQVANVYEQESALQFILPDFTDSTSFFGAPDNKYFLDDYTRFITMEEVLREYVSEVQVRRSRDNFHLRMLNTPYKTFFETDPLVLLDGVPIFNMNKVIALDPLKIKKLEVISRKFYQSGTAYPGILSYSTYQGDLAGYELDPNAIVVRYDGLQIRREFYSPAYETPEQQQSRMPDFRTTVFWQPNNILNKDSINNLQFFASDLRGNYLVVIEGLSNDGKPGSGKYLFNVK